ncbi:MULTISPECIES: DUF7935 family protein [Tenacibaculum]|uniref:DUF7935 family protein n=2 Tax=Flavobacteriaceae TaxID=49546 RepID=UPI001F0AE147|nr:MULTISPECIES: hypothetical protein [Tenacibaculum]MCH3882275.1 hypothetical protein [Tenacibaculum aquimarinum]MDO6599907.1 hypothetical protein [Tenacibaculum sp. 1_MG-2023]
MEDKIIEGLAYALPAAVTGFVAYMILSQFISQDNNEKKFNALVEKKRESLPLKLQAYERLLLFCERLNPSKLLLRIKPIGDDTTAYANLLIASVEQEYEHNMVQQLYISDESWKAILAAKNIITSKIRKVAEKAKSAQELRENILIDISQEENPTDIAIIFIKREVKKLL